MKSIYVARRATKELLHEVKEVDGKFVPVYKNVYTRDFYTLDDERFMIVDTESITLEEVSNRFGQEVVYSLMHNRAVEVDKDPCECPPQFRRPASFCVYVPLGDGRTLMGRIVMSDYTGPATEYRHGGRWLNDVDPNCVILSERV